MRLKTGLICGIGAITVLAGYYWYLPHRQCEERGKAFGARLQEVKSRFEAKILVGKGTDEVAQAFAAIHVAPHQVDEKMARGTIQMRGCGQLGCGDSAVIEITVTFDGTRHVTSTDVYGRYDNCL